MQGRGKGCGLFCLLKLPYLEPCLNNFVADCSIKDFLLLFCYFIAHKNDCFRLKKAPYICVIVTKFICCKSEAKNNAFAL